MVLDSTVVFSELMYNAPADPNLEWVELHNTMAVNMDLSGWSISGIGYIFPPGTVVEAGSYTVIAKQPVLLAAHGFANALGPYGGQLSNSGETLQLVNNSGRIMDALSYEDRGAWPVGPDGSGASLSKIRPDGGSTGPNNWNASRELGGTPGEVNFTSGPRTGPATTIIAADAIWRYDDSGINRDDVWLSPTFNPNDPDGNGSSNDAWLSGPAVLGNEATPLSIPLLTTLNLGATTYYFRTSFNFSGAPSATELRLRPLVDDGAIVYLNGQEVARINMPAGDVNYLTPALSAVRNASSLDEIVIASSSLAVGANILSVEVHQSLEDSQIIEEAVVLTNGGLQLIEEGPVAAAAGNPAPNNLATGAIPFARDELGLGIHLIRHLNDGKYGNSFSWIGNGAVGTSGPFVGINLGASPIHVSSIAFGRSNVLSGDPCGAGVCTDRTLGLYRLQYTTVPNPNALTPDSSWSPIGTLDYQSAGGTNFNSPHRRHRYNFNPVMATGIRLIVPASGIGSGTAIDEIELYGDGGESDLEIVPENGFSISWDGNEGTYFSASNPAVVPDNLVLSTPTLIPFGSSQATVGGIDAIADGEYGNGRSWTSNGASPAFIGLAFATSLTFDRLAFGRDNGNSSDIGCSAGQCTDDSLGIYQIQITDVATPNSATADTGNRVTGWQTVGSIAYNSASTDFRPYLRHEFQVTQDGAAISARGVRLVISDPAMTIDELELSLAPVPTGVVLNPEVGFNITWNGNDGDNFDPTENAPVPDNLALASGGTIPFASSELGPSIGLGYHRIVNINDGIYGNGKSWIGGSDAVPFLGVNFGGLVDVDRVAWGRDNGRFTPTSEECGGTCNDRNLGTYTLQYTTVANPGSATAATGLAATGWQSLGDVVYQFSADDEIGGGFTPHLRHEFVIRRNGDMIQATGLRLIVPAGTAIDEFEAYGPEDPDVAFGLSLTASVILPDAANVVISEVAGSSGPFFIEIANYDTQSIDLTGYVVASIDATKAAYVLPARTVSGGGFLQITASELGFTVEEGERLFLFGPGRATYVDGVVVDRVARARSVQHDGAWLYPDIVTPGAENHFALESDIVINEIMYQAPGFSSTDTPATFESTTLVAIDATTEWRYRDVTPGLAAGWATSPHALGLDSWKSGPGLIGFEDPVLDQPVRTTVPQPSVQNPRVITYYFEREFQLTSNPASDNIEILVSHYIDDGAIFYVNGVEFHRYKMTADAFDASTLATESISNAQRVDGLVIPKNLLHQGGNRLSVEVHQGTANSSDVVFGVEIIQRTIISPFVPGMPYTERDEEWIEIFNRSTSRLIDLSGWRLTDGVDYQFPAGTTLAPQSFLVVAGDAVAVQNNYPAFVRVVGEYDGTLGNGGDNIVLRDAVGNPADSVHYLDGGRWSELADGGGSSLQLVDPFADNSVPEVWRPSDESLQSEWETISYRGSATSDGFTNGVTNLYREFILGFLDSGAALIDDVSVIEDPAGLAIERIQNGSFEADTLGGPAAKWRINGTHSGTVVVDPTDTGNQVLRLTSSGALEDRYNHAETTFVGNAAIRDGVTYEISFRAKWLSGSNQLNSHLYFNRLPQTTLLERPSHFGSPGAGNNAAPVNVGPTYEGLSHFPVVPNANQPVTISVKANDSDAIQSLLLWYRVDNGAFQSTPMSPTSNDRFQAVVPGFGISRVVQFYVEGTDVRGASSFFPADGPQSRALYKVQDGLANNGARHDFRIVMTPADTTFLHLPTNVLSNADLGATIIYNESEVFYDVGVRLKGSNAGRSSSVYHSYSVSFDPMQLFRGEHESVSIDRSGRSSPTPLTQDEILIKHIGNAAGDIPYMYDDLVQVIAPNPSNSRPALLMMSSYDDGFLESQFAGGEEGTVFKLDIAYVPNGTVDGNPESLKLAFPYSHPQPTKDLQNLGDDKEAYRTHILIRNNRAADDYSQIIDAAKTLALSGSALLNAAPAVIDVDQWARVFALQSLSGAADVYTRGDLHHNINFYVRPEDGKVLALPWDWDFAFTASTSQGLIGTSGNGGKLMSTPGIARLVHGHLLDIINTTFNNTYLDPWIDHYGEVAGQSLTPIKSYVAGRRTFVLNNLPPVVPFAITTNSGNNVSTTATSILLSGQGWVDVREIRLVNTGENLPVRWVNDNSWQVTLPLALGANLFQLQAVDHQGIVVGTDSIEVTSSAANPVVASLRISEINYNPAAPTAAELAVMPGVDNDDFEFVEFQNIGTSPIDVTNVHFDAGVTYVFPTLTIPAGGLVVVVQDTAAFRLRYGNGPTVAGEFLAGNLSNAGERVAIDAADGVPIVDFVYSDSDPWPERADGVGGTLELINPATASVGRLSEFASWRGSTLQFGSPGAVGIAPLGVVVNEILSHTDAPLTRSDAIELFNPTSQSINIGGWYLSDSGDNPLKYAIPAGTILAAGAYLVFDESDFNPTPLTPAANHFALDAAEGDDVWLVVRNNAGGIAQFVDEVHFDAAANGQAWGRSPNGIGRLAPMERMTFGCQNSAPSAGPVVISEIRFAPSGPSAAALALDPGITAADLRFIEIHNPTFGAVNLSDWRLRGGVNYDFALGTTLPANGTVVLLTFDPESVANTARLAAFRAHYGIGANVRLLGEFSGQLSSTGDFVWLQRPDAPPVDNPTLIPRLTEDLVRYEITAPWPADTVGTVRSLQRISPTLYGDQVTSWASGVANPGTTGYINGLLGDVTGDGQRNAFDIDAIYDEVRRGSGVTRFDLNNDNRVSNLDVEFLVESVLGTRLGDANLDRRVDAADFALWQQNAFGDCGYSYRDGDFSGDGLVDGTDFNIWLGNRFFGAAAEFAASRPIPRAPLAQTDARSPLSSPSVTDATFAGWDFQDERRDARPRSGPSTAGDRNSVIIRSTTDWDGMARSRIVTRIAPHAAAQKRRQREWVGTGPRFDDVVDRAFEGLQPST